MTVGFEETNYTVNENSGSVTFCFTATGNLGPGIVIMVIVTSQEITAEGISLVCCKCNQRKHLLQYERITYLMLIQVAPTCMPEEVAHEGGRN